MHKNPKLLDLKSYTTWMLATLPANIAYAPLATLVPLYILALGGNALDVAVAVAGFNIVAMFTSFIWGRIIDATGKRKQAILIAYACITVLLFAMYTSSTIYEIFLLYAGIAIVQPASTTAYNLLVMETDGPSNWSKNFSRLQAIGNVGMVAGLIVAAIVTQFSSLRILILIFALASLVSTAFAAIFIVDPKVSFKGDYTVSNRINHLVLAMVSYPFRMLRFPRPRSILRMADPQRLAKWLKMTFPLLCISWLVFNIGMSMVNTEYPASLHIHGLPESLIFDIILAAMVAQTVLFYYVQRYVNKEKLRKTASSMMAVRGICYVITGASFLIVGIGFIASNFATYILVAGISYPIYYTASYTLLFNSIGSGKRGNALGIYNGIGWIGYFLGSVLDGAILGFGFPVMYLVAGLIVLASIIPMRIIPNIIGQPPAAVPTAAHA